jgi:hypothetical protein
LQLTCKPATLSAAKELPHINGGGFGYGSPFGGYKQSGKEVCTDWRITRRLERGTLAEQ